MSKAKTERTKTKTKLGDACQYLLMSRIREHPNVHTLLENPRTYIPVDDRFMVAKELNIPVPTINERKKYKQLVKTGITGEIAVKVVNHMARELDATGELAKLPENIFMSLNEAQEYMRNKSTKVNNKFKEKTADLEQHSTLPNEVAPPLITEPGKQQMNGNNSEHLWDTYGLATSGEVDLDTLIPLPEQLDMNEVPFPYTTEQATVVDTTNIEGMDLLSVVNEALRKVSNIIPNGKVSIMVEAGDGFTVRLDHQSGN